MSPLDDGAEWIVERLNHGRYQSVQLWSPDEVPVRELGVDLFKTGKLYEMERLFEPLEVRGHFHDARIRNTTAVPLIKRWLIRPGTMLPVFSTR